MTKPSLRNTIRYTLGAFFIATLLWACDNKPPSQTSTENTQTPTATASDAGGDTASAAQAAMQSDPKTKTHEFSLDNGLKVIVREDHRAPVVVSQVWYKAGSSYETNGTTGVAHVLEHMMFKGTQKYGPNEFSKIISANGGKENAFTGQDYTAYFQQLEKDRLRISFEMEADRMQNLMLSEEEFSKEIKVVMEERRMRTEDKPQSLTYEQFIATAFISSPYRHPIIGWMDDLQNMKAADAQNWYNHYYAPNNATVVVVGDVDPQQVYQLAQQHFGPIPKKEIPALKPQKEAPQKGVRRVSVKAPAQLPYMLMGYKVPVLSTAAQDWEPYAIEMLAHVLDGGNSARFTKNLVRGQQIASSIGAGYDLHSRLGDLFYISATPAQTRSIEELEQAILEQINTLKQELVSAEEIERIKAQVVASKVYEKDSVFYQAMQIGTLETVGLDWRIADEFVERINAVTPEQIQQVAKKYLIDDVLTVAVLDPQPINQVASAHRGGNHAH